MAEVINNVNKSSKRVVPKMPKGAKILSKNVRVEVEEIENGYLISKCYDIKYEYESGTDRDIKTDYLYYSRKWFSKTDPLEIKIDDKSLADSFED